MPISISEQDPATRLSLQPSVPTPYRTCLASPCWHTPHLLQPGGGGGLGVPSPSSPPLHNPTMLVTWSLFLPFTFLASRSTSPHHPLSSHGLGQGHVHSGLSNMSQPLAVYNKAPFIYNKPSPPAYLGAIVFFPFHFFISFICCQNSGPVKFFLFVSFYFSHSLQKHRK